MPLSCSATFSGLAGGLARHVWAHKKDYWSFVCVPALIGYNYMNIKANENRIDANTREIGNRVNEFKFWCDNMCGAVEEIRNKVDSLDCTMPGGDQYAHCPSPTAPPVNPEAEHMQNQQQ